MPKDATSLDYVRRIDRVITYMTGHLDEPLDVESLADVACFSPYHFHRIFRHMTGEPVTEAVRRIRLHRATGDLIKTAMPMVEVARRAGYGSVAAFNRAFRTAFGVPPATYRRQGRLIPLPSVTEEQERTMYEIEIRDERPVHLAALSHRGPYMEIGHAFERLHVWAAGRSIVGPATRTFGIYHDDPGQVKPEDLRSEAAISVDPDIAVSDDVHAIDLPGGRYAVLIHKGPYAELEKAYKWLYGTWLPQSGEEPDDRPCYEEYLNNPRDLPPAEWLTEICLPLKPAA